jgi:tetratricopeptide (TPR) repeat protein
VEKFDEAEQQVAMAINKAEEAGEKTAATNLQSLVSQKRKAYESNVAQRKIKTFLTEGNEVLAKSGDVDAARLKFEAARKEDQNNKDVLGALKRVDDFAKYEQSAKELKSQKKFDESLAQIKLALEIAPNSASARKIYDDVDKIQSAANAEKLDKEKKRNSYNAAMSSGDQLFAQKKYLDALRDFEKAIPFAQTDAETQALNRKLDAAKSAESKRVEEYVNGLRAEIDGKLAAAEKAKGTGDFEGALKITEEAKEFVGKNAELSKIGYQTKVVNKEEEIRTARDAKQESKYISTMRGLVASKVGRGEVSAALLDVKRAKELYANRKEVIDLEVALDSIIQIYAVNKELGEKFDTVKTKLAGRNAGELARLDGYRNSMNTTLNAAIADLGKEDFAGTSTLASRLKVMQQGLSTTSSLLRQLEEVARRPKPSDDPTNESGRPTDRSRVPDRRPDPPRRNTGSVGEGNVDD